MPKYLPNTRFSDCWGSAGDVTFYHRDGVCFWRKRACPEFPGTVLQMEQQSVHARALEAWRNISEDDREKWTEYATDVVTHKPPFDGLSRMSGHNLFVSAYHGFAQLGVERVPVPVPFEDFPVFDISLTSAEVLDGGLMRISFRVKLGDCGAFSRYRLAVRLQLTSVGGGKRPGLMRSFTALQNCQDQESEAVILIPDYRDVWDLDLKEYTVHVRYFLIDTLTGYRVRYKSKSFQISI